MVVSVARILRIIRNRIFLETSIYSIEIMNYSDLNVGLACILKEIKSIHSVFRYS